MTALTVLRSEEKIPYLESVVRDYILWRKVFKKKMNIFHNSVVLRYRHFGFLIFRAHQISREFMQWFIFVLFQKTYFNNISIFLSTYIGMFKWYFIKVKKKPTPISPKINLFHAISQNLHHRHILLVLFSEYLNFFWQICHNLRKSLRLLNYLIACWIVYE